MTILIRGGHLLTMDDAIGDVPGGDLLIDGSTIVSAGPSNPGAQADEVIDATGMIVLPGFVDTHIHLWQTVLRGLASELWHGEYFTSVLPYRSRFRPEDVYAGGLAGGRELLGNGVTTALDFCHCIATPRHSDMAVAGLIDSGIRGVHGYSLRDKPPGHFTSHDQRLADAVRVQEGLGHDRVSLMLALSDLETVDLATSAKEVAFARERGLGMTIHSNYAGQITAMHEAGLLGPDLVPVHGNVVTDDEIRMLADADATLSSTPAVEIGLGSSFSIVRRAVKLGLRVGWGCDIVTYTDADLLGQMRLGYQLTCYLDSEEERSQGRDGRRRPGIPTLTAREVLRMATVYGARALGLSARIGSLTPGKEADVILVKGGSLADPAAHVLMQCNGRDVDTVLVAGEVRKRAGQHVGLDPERSGALIDAARAHVLAEFPSHD
ncbi:amidohydrolase family protein [Nonomuraea endophytica]|uniref:Cytosine/adenosine deaminase-related metal-dependent hydrolase n=1 Tax=Nonomuraea endophytica TaxID=714136 RepID=A0A7W8AEV9_9ACTN|nr:amidohydrolase family protein [Nonomuraea endophytica]MBB5084884.1 cytosine/adenosine deaminase-related metal-dependent hydrolase [Nonomuraea endophytica]